MRQKAANWRALTSALWSPFTAAAQARRGYVYADTTYINGYAHGLTATGSGMPSRGNPFAALAKTRRPITTPVLPKHFREMRPADAVPDAVRTRTWPAGRPLGRPFPPRSARQSS